MDSNNILLHYGEDENKKVRYQAMLIDFGLVRPAREYLEDCFSNARGRSDLRTKTSEERDLWYLNAALNDPVVRNCVWTKYHKDEVMR